MFVVKDIAQKRYDICKTCSRFNTTLYICKECGCFMKAKVKFYDSFCPVGKWPAYTIEGKILN